MCHEIPPFKAVSMKEICIKRVPPSLYKKQQKIQSIYFELVVLFLSSLILALTLAPDNQHRLAFFNVIEYSVCIAWWSFSLNFIFPFGVSNSIPSIFLIKVSTSVSPFVFFKGFYNRNCC